MNLEKFQPRYPLGQRPQDNETVSYSIWKICQEIVGELRGKITFLSRGWKSIFLPLPDNLKEKKSQPWDRDEGTTLQMRSRRGLRIEIEIPLKYVLH